MRVHGQSISGLGAAASVSMSATPESRAIRMLRLPAVKQITGLGKTKIYELQAAGDFPMRVHLTAHCVGWVERDVQAWLSRRVDQSQSLQAD